MAKANPPPFIKIPQQFLADREVRKYFQNKDFILFQLWKKTGGGADLVAESNQFVTTNQAELNKINQIIGKGNELTSDETGFTVDSTALTVDMTNSVGEIVAGESSTSSVDLSGFVSNVDHTGHIVGATSTALQSAAITDQATVTAVDGDFVLISDTSDSGNLKRVDVAPFLSAAAAATGSGGIFDCGSRFSGDAVFDCGSRF